MVAVEADRDGETLKMRVQGIERLDTAAANVQRGLKLVLDEHVLKGRRERLAEIKSLLKPGGKGEIRLSVEVAGVPGVSGRRQIEMALPGRYEVGPLQRGQLATVPGVVEVLEI